jgi:CheY-like chemotaxis protein
MGHIIVIEDNPQSARMAEKLLRRAGHEVLLAEDGETGLLSIFDNRPDLVLIDLGLPDIDGQTVIAMARQQAHLAEIPIIAFTAWPADRAVEMARSYGCDGVITKPIDTRTFAKSVESYLTIAPTTE